MSKDEKPFFRPAPDLHLPAFVFYQVPKQALVRIVPIRGGGHAIDVAQATSLRNWLNKMLPKSAEDNMRSALVAAADVLKRCASECCDCNYGDGATGLGSEGEPCEECREIREAEQRAREAAR